MSVQSPGSFADPSIRVHKQNILLSQASSVFSFSHASWQIKDGCRFTVISCMEHSLLSALLWGVKEGERKLQEEGAHCDRFDQENVEDVTTAVSRAKP